MAKRVRASLTAIAILITIACETRATKREHLRSEKSILNTENEMLKDERRNINSRDHQLRTPKLGEKITIATLTAADSAEMNKQYGATPLLERTVMFGRKFHRNPNCPKIGSKVDEYVVTDDSIWGYDISKYWLYICEYCSVKPSDKEEIKKLELRSKEIENRMQEIDNRTDEIKREINELNR